MVQPTCHGPDERMSCLGGDESALTYEAERRSPTKATPGLVILHNNVRVILDRTPLGIGGVEPCTTSSNLAAIVECICITVSMAFGIFKLLAVRLAGHLGARSLYENDFVRLYCGNWPYMLHFDGVVCCCSVIASASYTIDAL